MSFAAAEGPTVGREFAPAFCSLASMSSFCLALLCSVVQRPLSTGVLQGYTACLHFGTLASMQTY